MSDHEHTWDSDHGSHGIPAPPDDDDLSSIQVGGVMGVQPVPLHFFKGPGPMNVRPVRKKKVGRKGQEPFICEWEFRWYLDRVEGTTRPKALRKIYDVLLHPRAWTRSGVHWKRVMERSQADILIRVIPQDTTVCGKGAAGCYSWGYEPDGKPVAEMGVEYIDRPGPWAALIGMELQGHGTFRGDDMYFDIHAPYSVGVMGTWDAMARAQFYPTDQEIEDTRTWLRGETPPDRIHRH